MQRLGRKQVDVFVDRNDPLRASIGERGHQRITRLAASGVRELQPRMEAPPRSGNMHVAERRRDGFHDLVELAFHGHVVGHQHVGEPGAVIVIDRILAHRDAGDVTHGCGRLWAEIARVLAERTVRRERIAWRPAFHHDLRVGGHHDALAVRQRRHEPQRFAEHAARRAPVAFGVTQLRLGAHQHRWMVSDPECDRARLTTRPELAQVARVVARRIREPAHALRALQPAALNRRIVDPGLRIESRRMCRRQVGPWLQFVLGQCRNPREIGPGAREYNFLHRRLGARHDARIDAGGAAARIPLCGLTMVRDAERPCGQHPTRGEIRDDGESRGFTARAARARRDENRILTARIERVLESGELVKARDARRQCPHCFGVLREECPEIERHVPLSYWHDKWRVYNGERHGT